VCDVCVCVVSIKFGYLHVCALMRTYTWCLYDVCIRHTCVWYLYVYTCVCVYAYMCGVIAMCDCECDVCMYVYVCVYMRVCVCVNMM